MTLRSRRRSSTCPSSVFSARILYLPSPETVGTYIINLQDSVDEKRRPLPGTHWTASYIEKGGAVYFDSFGFPPPAQVCDFLRAYRPFAVNRFQLQNIRSGVCGYYCLYFLWFMWKHRRVGGGLSRRLELLLSKFSLDDPKKNRAILEKRIRPL